MPIRNQLAQKNIGLSQQIELCKQGLYSYSAESSDEDRPMVEHYYRKWFLLQAMQERAMSSHEQYDLLTQQVKNIELLEGFGLLMREIAEAMRLYADSLLTAQPYKHPALEWTVSATRTCWKQKRRTTLSYPVAPDAKPFRLRGEPAGRGEDGATDRRHRVPHPSTGKQ